VCAFIQIKLTYNCTAKLHKNMKYMKQIFYSATILTLVISFGCSVPTNMLNNNYTVTPNPLEVKGDSITITVNATVPPKSINPKADIRFEPYLSTSKGEVALKKLSIGGEKSVGTDLKVNSKTGGEISYTEKIAYSEDFKRATLYPNFSIKTGTEYKEVKDAKGTKVLAEGTITTALLAAGGSSSMVFEADNYASTPEIKMVNIYFAKDDSKFNASFKVKNQFDNKKQIDSLITLLKVNKDWTVKNISINSFASPDGELARNENLSKARSESSFNYFKKELKKLGFSEVNDENFKMGATLSEDWAGYQKAVAACNHVDKDGVLGIIQDKSISDDNREAKIKKDFPKFWTDTKDNLLPTLRRSELVINGQKPLKSDDELKANSSKLDSLTDSELIHLASITTDMSAKGSIYTAMTSKYPEDWRGFNGLGAVQVAGGNTTQGMPNLYKANSLSPENAVVLTNLGNAALMSKDYTKAFEYFKAAAAKGGDASYGLGIMDIKKGDYASAVSNLNKANKKDFNLPLAQLLNGQAEAAKASINGLKPEELTWMHYYIVAIVGARTANQDVLTTNLTRAVQLNAGVREMAKTDMEFFKFWSNPAFQGAIR
jgi:tetratricopeptide (TPR) repeat protein